MSEFLLCIIYSKKTPQSMNIERLKSFFILWMGIFFNNKNKYLWLPSSTQLNISIDIWSRKKSFWNSNWKLWYQKCDCAEKDAWKSVFWRSCGLELNFTLKVILLLACRRIFQAFSSLKTVGFEFKRSWIIK